jgi:metal-responsive CopG/Arc/MetJ family transcriptional regulator
MDIRDLKVRTNMSDMVKQRVSLTVRKELLAWIDGKVKLLVYASRSHAFESLIAEAMKQEKRKSLP